MLFKVIPVGPCEAQSSHPKSFEKKRLNPTPWKHFEQKRLAGEAKRDSQGSKIHRNPWEIRWIFWLICKPCFFMNLGGFPVNFEKKMESKFVCFQQGRKLDNWGSCSTISWWILVAFAINFQADCPRPFSNSCCCFKLRHARKALALLSFNFQKWELFCEL